MGKFIVVVSGTDRKGEIISNTHYLSSCTSDIEDACRQIYEEEWSRYSPVNIEVKVIDIDNMYHNFIIDKNIQERIGHIIYNNKRKKSDEIVDNLKLSLGRIPTQEEVLNEFRRVCDEIG